MFWFTNSKIVGNRGIKQGDGFKDNASEIKRLLIATLKYVTQEVVMSKSEFENRKKPILIELLVFDYFSAIVTKSRKLLLGTLIDVIRPVVIAKEKTDYLSKTKTFGNFRETGVLSIKLLLFFFQTEFERS